jgi:hemerythrin superfamily protein
MVDDRDITREDEDDIVNVLLRQHVRIKVLMADVRNTTGVARRQAFDELRELLAAHETGEEMVLRPATQQVSDAGRAVASARNQEEAEATAVLADLEKLDVDSAEFSEQFADFEKAVIQHAESEESEEFPLVSRARSHDQLIDMARAVILAEKTAPTHPHPVAGGSPTAQVLMGPFVSLLDRARDAITSSRR